MSVKLPLIVKREVKPSPRKSSQPQEEEELPKRNSEASEENYEDDQFQEDAVQESVEPAPPPQTFAALKKAEEPLEQLESQLINSKVEQLPTVQNDKRKEELQKILEERIQQAAALRESVAERKKEIKTIGEQIDRDLNKSLLRTVKQNTVSIRDIFSAPPKTSNKRINDLNEELRNVRIAIKKVKAEIQKIMDGMMDPVSQLNQEKGIDFEARIKGAEEDIRRVEGEKAMLTEEIARGNKDFNEEEERQRADEYSKLNASLTEVLTAQKECRGSINQLDRQDILHMEKIKFFQERESGLGQPKKGKPSEKDRLRMDEEIRQLILDINEIIEDRNRIQSEKKSNLKSLTNQAASIETKNWDLCNKLRDIDSFLLQYYEKKSKRKEAKLDRTEKESSEPAFDKSASGKIEPQSISIETPSKTIEYDDKNKKSVPDIVLTERKKSYEFSFKEAEEGDVQLSDEFLGGKLNILRITLIADDTRLFSIKATYQFNLQQIEGYVLGSKNTPQNANKIEINLDREALEIINFMHVGYNEEHLICYLQIVTTEGQEHRWGSAERAIKSDQKHIKKYQFCFMKAKMTALQEENQFAISGVTLSTIYLSAK